MAPGLKHTSGGSFGLTAPHIPHDDNEHEWGDWKSAGASSKQVRKKLPASSIKDVAPHSTRAEHLTPRAASEDNTGDMPHTAAEHADFLQNSYVQTTIDSAWSAIIDGQFISSAWANAGLLSLSRLKQHIKQETHAPVTLEALLHAEPPRTKHQKRSWWSNVESISRCVAGYHHAVGASEHDVCHSIHDDICAYAQILRRGLSRNVDITEFLTLLHRAITNRALNMALRTTIDQTLSDDLPVGPQGRRVTRFGRQALADILEQCLDIVKDDYQRLQIDMKRLRRQ